jgi:acyl carrier protein
MSDVHQHIESIVLHVHKRNGGKLDKLDFDLRMLDPQLGIDSLDLAEVMVEIERQFGVSPFESGQAPRTWAEVVRFIEEGKGE